MSRTVIRYGGTLEAGKGIPLSGAAADTVCDLMAGSHPAFVRDQSGLF